MSKKQKRRIDDVREAKKLDARLDAMYTEMGFSIERVNDTKRQLEGIDVILRRGDEEYLVDEKAAIKYWDFDIQTFACEFACLVNKDRNGWFTNPESKTTHYAFIYVRSLTEDMYDVYNIEMLLIEKATLKKYFRDNMCATVEQLMFRLNNFGIYGNSGKRYRINDDLEIMQNEFLREKPLLVLVSRSALRKLAIVTRTWCAEKAS